jgi:hypothetical protein
VDQSINVQPAYGNLTTKAKLVEKKDPAAAKELRAQAMKVANETDINLAGTSSWERRSTPRRSSCSGRT